MKRTPATTGHLAPVAASRHPRGLRPGVLPVVDRHSSHHRERDERVRRHLQGHPAPEGVFALSIAPAKRSLRKAAGFTRRPFCFSGLGRRVHPTHTAARPTDPPIPSTDATPDPPTSTRAGATQEGKPMLAPLSNEQFNEDWWDDAACRDGEASLSGVFFSEELQDIARAKAICAECPVMDECLEGAIVRREPWGVWGGQLFLNGKILATKRRRGRPPKTPAARGSAAPDPDPCSPRAPGPAPHRVSRSGRSPRRPVHHAGRGSVLHPVDRPLPPPGRAIDGMRPTGTLGPPNLS